MSIFDPDSYLDYDTVNEWFIRALKPGVRPVAGVGDDQVFDF